MLRIQGRIVFPLLIPLLAAATAARASAAVAQEAVGIDHGPRFFWRASSRATPVEIDLNATPILRRRVTLGGESVTMSQLLAAIQKQTGLKFIYSGDVIP